DVGFYMFELPFWRMLHGSAAGVVALTAVFVLAVYMLARAVEWTRSRLFLDDGPRPHLLALAAAGALLKALDYRLALFVLQLCHHGDRLYGDTYSGTYARAAALRALLVLAVLAAVLLAYNMCRTRLRPLAAAGLLWLVASVVLGGLYPALLQRFVV